MTLILKDKKFGRLEASGLAQIIRGLCRTHKEDYAARRGRESPSLKRFTYPFNPMTKRCETKPSSLWEIVCYFLKLGTIGFGGPIGVSRIHGAGTWLKKRGWITETDYKQGLALAQLAPGPLAAQLAIYIGYVHSGILGATLVGIAFVLPLVSHGAGHFRGVCPIRRFTMDAGTFSTELVRRLSESLFVLHTKLTKT